MTARSGAVTQLNTGKRKTGMVEKVEKRERGALSIGQLISEKKRQDLKGAVQIYLTKYGEDLSEEQLEDLELFMKETGKEYKGEDL